MRVVASQPDSGSTPSLSPSAESSGPGVARGSGTSAGIKLPIWLLTLGAGLGAGLVSCAGGESFYDWFRLRDAIVYPPNYERISGYQKVAVTAQIETKALVVVERKRSAAAFGLLGLVLGVSLGLIGGLAAGSARSAVTGAVAGGVAAAAAGGGLSFAATPLFFRYLDPEQGLLVLFLTHAAIFAALGAASGLALALGLGDRSSLARAVFGGLLGALVGTFAFETANAVAFPLMRTFEVVPTEFLPRFMMHLCVAVCTALMAGLAAGNPARTSATAKTGPT
jgi:hypothetical protein